MSNTAGETVLEMDGISKAFSGVTVLDDVHFDLNKGEVHALIGENGAGKSTLMKILNGIYSKDAGEIKLDGKPVNLSNVHEAKANGISIIHQELSLVPEMTVAENVFLGRMPTTKMGFIDDKTPIKETAELLHKFGLDAISPTALIKDLSVAQQQMVEIMRALSTNARILVMDEPTASLTDQEIEKLFVFIEDLKIRGHSIIYISHRMEELYKVCSRCTVLRDGKYVGTVDLADTDYNSLVSMMVGREFEDFYPDYQGKHGKELLRVKNLNAGKQVQDIGFELYQGEILGFYGLMGSGRTETMRALFGVSDVDVTSGEIFIEGDKVEIKTPADAISAGLFLAPENRKEQGLVLMQDIKYNITLSVMDEFIKGVNVNNKKEDEIANQYYDMLDIRSSGLNQLTQNLSGGNQQKVVLSKSLATKPKVLILDEPTRGVDVGAKVAIYNTIAKLAEQGIGIIIISSEMPEVINMSTRIYIMREGKIMGSLEGDDISEEKIIKFSLGGQEV